MIVLLPALTLVIVGIITLLLGRVLTTKGARGVLSFIGTLIIIIFSFSISALGPILSNSNTNSLELLGAAQSFLNYSGIYPLAGAIFLVLFIIF
ncbi:hypothetical protein [endosymbiont 'TC1' of Trimyema compressum]|uniref:hypothetical protein n=1 Tax=endosymbiont 'TC1' of Trimyema compressum TaxID=243899 RepID=UPI0013923F02|nr:hypothetical protein [endosymbiont 'TC1' of Trimyema compressum]